jgi:hypothetical protein
MTMKGELWQECRRRSCDTEPVCVHCEYCSQHCTCPPPPTMAEQAEEALLQAQKQAAKAAARQQALEILASPDADVTAIRFEYQLSNGTWTTLKPERLQHFLGLVLAREHWYAPRLNRAPMTTPREVALHIVTTGRDMAFGDDWYDRIRFAR